jgi:hypothetical protein
MSHPVNRFLDSLLGPSKTIPTPGHEPAYPVIPNDYPTDDIEAVGDGTDESGLIPLTDENLVLPTTEHPGIRTASGGLDLLQHVEPWLRRELGEEGPGEGHHRLPGELQAALNGPAPAVEVRELGAPRVAFGSLSPADTEAYDLVGDDDRRRAVTVTNTATVAANVVYLGAQYYPVSGGGESAYVLPAGQSIRIHTQSAIRVSVAVAGTTVSWVAERY